MKLFKRLFGQSKNEETSWNQVEFESKVIAEIKTLPEQDHALLTAVFKDLMSQKKVKSLTQKEQDLFIAMLKNISPNNKITTNTTESFGKELDESIRRYHSNPEHVVELKLKDSEGNKTQEYEALKLIFNEWEKVYSIWDRRSIIFEYLDKTEFNRLMKWQVVERYLQDRQVLKALEFKEKYINEQDLQDIRILISLSKLHRALDSISVAFEYAKKAFDLNPDEEITKVEYANVLLISSNEDNQKLAYKIITEVIESKMKAEGSQGNGILHYFQFSKDYIDSSVFAANFLVGGNCDLEAWATMSEEYYCCPEFRYEHAIVLFKQQEIIQTLAKLHALADEFPWYKKAVLTYIDIINLLRDQKNDPTFMTKEMKLMEEYKSKWNN